jgi:glutaminyl-peptide cyclotransferase
MRVLVGVFVLLSSCWSDRIQQSLVPSVVSEFRHDPTAFTQGLLIDQGRMYESVGLEGHSSLREISLTGSGLIREVKASDSIFAEGLAVWKDKLFQLTWKNKQIFVYDKENFEILGKVPWQGEGWGLTTLNDELVLSDGTSKLHFIQPQNGFRVARSVTVRNLSMEIDSLNELESVNGFILANVWQTDLIMVIDPNNGRVLEVWNLSHLKDLIPEFERGQMDVLNGIAWDVDTRKLYVTGKFWPRLFEIEVPNSIVFGQ